MVSQTLRLTESVRQWSAAAVTARLNAVDNHLRHNGCFLGRTPREVLGVFADGECVFDPHTPACVSSLVCARARACVRYHLTSPWISFRCRARNHAHRAAFFILRSPVQTSD